jgi:EmrB/QacA subfamily drug resistance transporter
MPRIYYFPACLRKGVPRGIGIRAPCDSGVVQGAPPSVSAEAKTEQWMLVASILGSSMAFIDGTVVNVALPVLQKALGATATQVQWVVESYALALAALLLLGGALADKVGRRRIFAVGVALFALASAGCALAPNINWLIATRAVQGLGGALLVPTSLALLGAGFPAERRGQAIGKWSAFSAAAAGVGPVLGGWLIQAASWRWVFWINIPIALAALTIPLRRVPESRDEKARRLDLPGAALATLGLGGLVFGLLEAPRLGLDHAALLTGLLGGALTLAVFVLVEERSPEPMVPLDLFRSRTFAGANLLTLLLYAALGGAFFFVPFDLIQVHDYSPAAAGAAMLPLIVLLSLLSSWAGRLADRYGVRRPLIIGPMIAAAGFALLALPGTGGSYWTTFFPGMVVLGLGMSGTVAPLTTAVMTSVGPDRAGVASGINNAVSRTAALLSIAAFGLVAYQRFGRSLAHRMATLGVPFEAREQLWRERGKLAALAIPHSLPDQLRSSLELAVNAAFVDAFRAIMLLAAALAAAACVVAWLLIEPSEKVKFTSSRQG